MLKAETARKRQKAWNKEDEHLKQVAAKDRIDRTNDWIESEVRDCVYMASSEGHGFTSLPLPKDLDFLHMKKVMEELGYTIIVNKRNRAGNLVIAVYWDATMVG